MATNVAAEEVAHAAAAPKSSNGNVLERTGLKSDIGLG